MIHYDATDYRTLFQNLLPLGPVWPRDPDTVQAKTLAALAAEWARLDARLGDLWTEADPRQTQELLTDWERLLGLPDDCMQPTVTIAERRTAIWTRLTQLGGQSRAFFIALAAALGYTITISEFNPFRIGSEIGTPLCDEEWQFVWQVNGIIEVEYFRVDENRVGDPLRRWSGFLLPCIFNRLKPAHTLIFWELSEDVPS